MFRAHEAQGCQKHSNRVGGTLYISGIMDVDVLLVSSSEPYKISRFSTIFTDAFASHYFENIVLLLRPTPIETDFRSHPLYLPLSPFISLYFPLSPYISVYLPPYISLETRYFCLWTETTCFTTLLKALVARVDAFGNLLCLYDWK